MVTFFGASGLWNNVRLLNSEAILLQWSLLSGVVCFVEFYRQSPGIFRSFVPLCIMPFDVSIEDPSFIAD